MNFVYPHFWHATDLTLAATLDLRVLLVLDGTTVDVDDANRDVTALDQFGTLDEHVAAGRMVLTGLIWAKDAAGNFSWLDADPVTWDPLPVAGVQDVKAALVYVHITDDTDSYPLGYFDTGGYPVTPTGLTRHTINWHATQGVLLARSGV